MKKIFIDEAPDYNRRNIKDELLAIFVLFLVMGGLVYLLTSEEEKSYLPWALGILLIFIIAVFVFSSGIAFHVYHLSIDGDKVTIEYLESSNFFRLKPNKKEFSIEGVTTKIVRNNFFYLIDAKKFNILKLSLIKQKGFDVLWNEVVSYYESPKS